MLGFFMLVFMTAACQPGEEQRNNGVDQSRDFTEVAVDLESPWDIEHDEGSFFISEREGTIALVVDGQVERQSVETEREITQVGEGGLLGLKLHPDFSSNQQAYAYHTYEDGGRTMNRVVVLEYEGGRWIEQESLLEEIPGSNFHNGGRIAIGPDEKLYVTTGDAQEESLAQDQNSLAGKILRLELDGDIPEDNPEETSYMYSYGHRNPQGMTWNNDGEMFASEHGPTNHDEINLIEPGQNYGWPDIVGDDSKEGMQQPLFQTGNNTWAPSGITVYEDSIFVAALTGRALYSLDMDGQNSETEAEGFGRVRDVVEVDGSLYFITNNTDGRGNPEEQDDQLVMFRP
ncbi:PQQ-dependent sugar dehydrogenase [Halobacillus campisalis]|uniref:PQQ-dependent sugar dehydrogenase n=2 Tax=Halobacillus campisalis TaxID=435909 RepID=A0ABW2JZJ1_9BACI|nr:PQQ-dependent sugar dehydrogenase [Halobacillus campisalis]